VIVTKYYIGVCAENDVGKGDMATVDKTYSPKQPISKFVTIIYSPTQPISLLVTITYSPTQPISLLVIFFNSRSTIFGWWLPFNVYFIFTDFAYIQVVGWTWTI
jgi:hypothetical protein